MSCVVAEVMANRNGQEASDLYAPYVDCHICDGNIFFHIMPRRSTRAHQTEAQVSLRSDLLLQTKIMFTASHWTREQQSLARPTSTGWIWLSTNLAPMES